MGGTRFLGPALIRNLAKDNVEITLFNRGNNYNNKLPRNIRRIRGDRRYIESMSVLSQATYDLVYDLCCFNRKDALNLLTNIRPPRHLVFLSSAAVYKKPKIFPLTEDSETGEWDSFGNYGTQKVEAENEFIAYTQKYKTKLTIFRPVYLLGKNNYFDRENFYFSRILNNDPILVPGKGNALIQFAFLEETAKAFKLIPQRQTQNIEILNVAGNEYISLKEFILLCAQIAKKAPILIELDTKRYKLNEEHFYDDFYPFPNLTFIVSNQKLSSRYGFRFASLPKGLKSIYKSWRKKWNGKTNKYPMELDILSKFQSI
jgi:dTDP-glucose 4,6-dehydratase